MLNQPSPADGAPDAELISRQLIGRLAAGLSVVSGLAVLLELAMPQGPGGWVPSLAAGSAGVLFGVVLWFLPWHRWSRRASLWIVPPALAMIAVGNVLDPAPYTYGLYYVVVFLWVGLAHRRGTSLRVLPLFVVAYVLPLLLAKDAPAFGLASVASVGAVCALSGEAVAWVTQRLRELEGEAQKGRTQAHFRALVQHSSDIVAIVDRSGTIQYMSPSVGRVLQRNPEDLIGLSLLRLLHPADAVAAGALLDELSPAEPSGAVEWRVQLAGGWRHLETVATNLLDDPDVQGIVLNSRDITEHKALEEQLAHRALHDGLTGLPNRALFHDRIDQAQARARRDGAQIAVLFLDLDNFKSVNDSLGHAGGDLVLIELAHRLRGSLREGDTLARFGADEFGILVEDVVDASVVTEIAERCLTECRTVFSVVDREISVEISGGLAFGRRGQHADALLREADVALYSAKARGKNRFEIFDAALDARTRERQQLEGDLRLALARGELRVYYQPIVVLADRSIKGVEALVRWEHPRRGLVLPDEFISIAEETGLIVPIGQWVLEQACAQVRAWRDQHPRYAALGVSVNLSARQFQRSDLVHEIARAAREARLEPEALTLEITESVVMDDPAAAAATLTELKALGFALAIDDFGTGYSSLSYLKHFPIDNLKIDRSFVDGLGADSQSTAIVRSVVDLAQALNVTITGEGIETSTQEAALRALGCDGGQGYLFARPLNALALAALLTRDTRAVDLLQATAAA